VSEAFELLPPRAGRSGGENASGTSRRGAGGRTGEVADDFSRKVYGLLGIPVDAIDSADLLELIEAAADNAAPCLISTPNVNFLVKSLENAEFRESMLLSSLCLVDGMPLIWIAKLLRIPIFERIAGADLFGRLKSTNGAIRRLRVFLLGGADGVAAAVGRILNSEQGGLECAGVLNPGFGTIDDMSSGEIIEAINASRSDLLAVFFGAEKAQAWLMRNHRRLRVPVRAQFGATINFEAGTVKRAPSFLRNSGFEWLWRIKEEPYLWRRYWSDGWVLLWLLLTCVVPLSIAVRWSARKHRDLSIVEREDLARVTIALSGSATEGHVDKAISCFRNALASNKHINLDVSNTQSVDPRFFGLFLMVRKQLASRGRDLRFTGVTPQMRRTFQRNRFEFLLSDRDQSPPVSAPPVAADLIGGYLRFMTFKRSI
jgi:N-acetylglucosaminyldiphosphoundecaprenol N-acetyl-beta-D-mannosaminyltransferase